MRIRFRCVRKSTKNASAETLLPSLDGVDLSLPAPHGRAVLLRLPLSEIGRRFGRS